MNTLTYRTVRIAKRTYVNNASSLIEAIKKMVALTPENDASIVDLEIAPQVDYQGGTAEKEGTICLFEEILSDGSKVYTLEVY